MNQQVQRAASWFGARTRAAQIGIAVGTLVVVCACCAVGLAAIGAGNNTGNTGNVAATATTAPGATHAPAATVAPSATPKPKAWTTIQHFSGNQNQTTPTFHVSDGDRIVWTDTPTDTNANLFSVELDGSDGTPIDLIANTANNNSQQSSTYAIHGDQDVFLKITADSVSYTVLVQQLR